MSHDHSHAGGHHSHHHVPSANQRNKHRLQAVLGLTSLFLVAEVVGGFLSGSLALLADAGHMLTDVAGLALALLALSFAERPATPERTYGYYRVEILAALLNAVFLIGVSVFIFLEAWERFRTPPPVSTGLMLAVAAGAVLTRASGVQLEGEALLEAVKNVECQTIGVPTGLQDYRPALYGGIAAVELEVEHVERLAEARVKEMAEKRRADVDREVSDGIAKIARLGKEIVSLEARFDELKSHEEERLKAENEALKAKERRGTRLQVSEKGGVSLYGMRRFPITFYKEQWAKLLDMADDIRAKRKTIKAKFTT